MPGPRTWFSALSLVLAAFLLTLLSCGGDSNGITPPDDDDPVVVASVTLSPSTASVKPGDTIRFTAAVRDAAGNTLVGGTLTWASSTSSVATVASTGLVTAVGPGQTTISATADGVVGSATLTVAQTQVVASGQVGSSGGSVGNADVGVTIPAGELSGTTTVEIVAAEGVDPVFGSSAVTKNYALRGFPADRDVDVRVRLKVTGTLDGPSLIAMSTPVWAMTTDTAGYRPGVVAREAKDSAGYLVATIPVRGATAAEPAPGLYRAAGVDGLLDGLLGGVTNSRTDTIPGKWVLRTYGVPKAQLAAKASKILKLLEDARATLEGQGYSMAHRTQWPMDVTAHPIADAYGLFGLKGPFPFDVNTGYFEFDIDSFDRPDMPGTAIHEFYHFIQAQYVLTKPAAQYGTYSWLKEASSTWVEEKAPETLGVFRNTFFYGQRGDLFQGLYPTLTASDGYGKAPLIKYISDNQGTAAVKAMWTSVGAGTGAIDALLAAIPGQPATWWPDLLTKYMKGEIISLTGEQLVPSVGATPMEPGVQSWTWNNKLRPLAAQLLDFTPVPAEYGTGTDVVFRLPQNLLTDGFKFLPFRMNASGSWEEQGGVQDSVVIKGTELKKGLRYGIYVIHTKPTAPYTQQWDNKFSTDFGYADGDWATHDAAVVNDAIAYTRPEGDTTTIDVAGQVVSTFTNLSQGGVWARDAQNPNKYVWKATPEFAAQLQAFKATAVSEALVRATGDSLYLTATVDINPPSSGADEPGSAAAFGGAALLLLTGLVFRRRRPVLVMALLGAVGMGTWGCDLGSINFSARFKYELQFAHPSLTASAEDANTALVKLTGGTGKMTVERYKSEWWKYIRDEDNQVVDSVAQTRTATGSATVTVAVDLFKDGIVVSDDDQLQAVSGSLQVDPDALRPWMERRRIR